MHSSKRPLRDVLAAGVSREYAHAEQICGVLFDVTSSNGEHFGLCVRLQGGRHVYVEPRQLQGVEVTRPMRVRDHANTDVLVAALSSGLRDELKR